MSIAWLPAPISAVLGFFTLRSDCRLKEILLSLFVLGNEGVS